MRTDQPRAGERPGGSTGNPRSRPRAGAASPWGEGLQDERMTHLIKSAFRCTSGALQKRLRAHGVLYGHWTFLRILWQTDGITQRQLSVQAGVTEASAVPALQAMEQRGYISRQKLDDNRKQVRVFLTPQGAALRPLIVACAQEVNELVVGGIPAQDLAATRRTLLAVIANLGREAAGEVPDARPRRGGTQDFP
jgi:DNA-binding MarR family transcriptional regulator